MDIVIDAQKVGVSFAVDGGMIEAVRNVSFRLHRGQTIALVGESGSGKSVTARAVMRLLSKRAVVSDATAITYNGKDMAHLSNEAMRKLRGDRISMIFQEPMNSLNPLHKIEKQVGEVLRLHQGLGKDEARVEVLSLLKKVGIDEAEKRLSAYPHEFTLDNYKKIFTDPTWYMGYVNSLEYVAINTVLSVTVALPAAYAFSRYRFLGDKHDFEVGVVNERQRFKIILPAPGGEGESGKHY